MTEHLYSLKMKRIKFDKRFKPGKHRADIFMWGNPYPPRLFPMHSSSVKPFQHHKLSQKRMVYITAAKDGKHCLGITDNDWTFVWGQSYSQGIYITNALNNEMIVYGYIRQSQKIYNLIIPIDVIKMLFEMFCNEIHVHCTGSLGLGEKVRVTLPYLLRPLRKTNVIQVKCSALHGMAVTADNHVFAWGHKTLTNLGYDTSKPELLPFLNGLDIKSIDCCSTHSVAYSNTNIYQFGFKGVWLGLKDANKSFGQVYFDDINTDNIGINKICVSNNYSLYLFTNGDVYATGINEHGKMGIIGGCNSIQKPVKIIFNDRIGEISAGQYHSGFIATNGKVYTTGLGKDYRLGHQNEETIYKPKLVEILKEVKCARIECLNDRTFVITKYGALLMFGVEPITKKIYSKPLVFNELATYRIYQICGGNDFCVALGVRARQLVNMPDIDVGHGFHIQLDADTHQIPQISQIPQFPALALPQFNALPPIIPAPSPQKQN
eukprot:96594_1